MENHIVHDVFIYFQHLYILYIFHGSSSQQLSTQELSTCISKKVFLTTNLGSRAAAS